jgi:hypothetical protein
LVSHSKRSNGFRVTEKEVLRRAFRPEKKNAVRGLRELHNEELHNLHILPHTSTLYYQNYYIMKENEMGGTYDTQGEDVKRK